LNFFLFIIRIHGLSNYTTWLNNPFWLLNISILTGSSSVKWHVQFLIKQFDQDDLFDQVSKWTFSQNVLKNEYPNQNDIWFSQKWQGVPILLRYLMGFVDQNGIWPNQRSQGVHILCKYPRGLVGQNGTWPCQNIKILFILTRCPKSCVGWFKRIQC
jgi:hypothetical protein